MAANGNDNNIIRRIIRGIYTGDELPVILRRELIYGATVEGEVILPDVTNLEVDPNITAIPLKRFFAHQNIVELVCHKHVNKIETQAFSKCPHLIQVDMNGVEEVEDAAFELCTALKYVKCNKLEKVGYAAFAGCDSLSGIDLPSARTVEVCAFTLCEAMKEVTFGPSLESVELGAFTRCYSLERITIPLKNGLFPEDSTFIECGNLGQVFLVEEGILNGTVAALFLDEWRQDMRRVIDSINLELPNAYAGDWNSGDDGEKTIVIRSWIESVLSKIIDYKAQHRGLFNAYAAEPSLLHPELPDEIVRNNVLPFLELPSHTFDGEDNTVVINPRPRELNANATGFDVSDQGTLQLQPLLQLMNAESIEATMPLLGSHISDEE